MAENGIIVDIPQNLENLQLPSSELLNYYNMRDERILYIDFEIDMTILEIQREIITFNLEDRDIPIEQRKPIKLLIDTNGGNLIESMSLVSIIQMSKTPVWTINIGSALSGGALILLAGHKRFALSYSVAMIHTGNGGFEGTYEQVEAQQKMYKRLVEKMLEYIKEKTTIEKGIFSRNKAKDWYIDSSEQLKYGFVDEIIDNIFDYL